MANLDAVTVANNAVRLGLLTPEHVQQAWEQIDKRTAEALPFLLAMERKGYLTPWQSHKLLKEDRDGFFLGGHRILYKIASGSFGRVYRADDPRTGRIVAIKVLRRKWSENKNAVDLFIREGKLGMTLRHPGIVEIIAVGLDATSGQHYIIMEFVEGENLRQMMERRKKLEPIEALRILEDCTAGLAFAFARGVTHRDMKPSNILISTQGAAKLVDFGLAEVRAQVNEDIVVDRTVDYAGLEMATGVPPGDTRSDIFFLGCVAYQMFTGRFPLKLSRNAKVRMSADRFVHLKSIAREEVQQFQSIPRLVDNMMSLNAEQRFQTPSQVLEAVREVRREVDLKERPEERKAAEGPRTIFIVEKDARLQDVFRERFKEKGFRVLLAADPARALDRFRVQPYDLLIIDAGTTGENGLLIFERILKDAANEGLPCQGVLLLSDEQLSWKGKISPRPNQAVLIQPIKFKQLLHKAQEMLGMAVS